MDAASSFDGRHLALESEQTDEGITCDLLIKLRTKQLELLLPSLCSFISCVAGNCPSTQLIAAAIVTYQSSISLGFIEVEAALCGRTVIHSAPPAPGKLGEARWRHTIQQSTNKTQHNITETQQNSKERDHQRNTTLR